MATLYLVRHGQASFGAADYDVLSPRGAEQSRRLGAALAEAKTPIDAVYVGGLRRQRETWEHLRAGAAEHGLTLPDACVDDDLREYPAHVIVQHFAREVAASDPALGPLLAVNGGGGLSGALPEGVDAKSVQNLFESIMERWGHGQLSAPHIEAFATFMARIDAVLTRVLAGLHRGQRALVITSGGPVAAAAAHALGLGTTETLRLSWVVSNASLTELRHREDRLSLWRFNGVAHLGDGELVTYR